MGGPLRPPGHSLPSVDPTAPGGSSRGMMSLQRPPRGFSGQGRSAVFSLGQGLQSGVHTFQRVWKILHGVQERECLD